MLDTKWQYFGIMMLALIVGSACRSPGGDSQMSPEQRQRLSTFRSRGTQASVTIFPVYMGNGAFSDVAEVLALLLERSGMHELQVTDQVFHMPPDAAFDQAPALFGAFVREQAMATDYALYAECLGTPETGPREIRSLIVDRSGRVVLVDRQTTADRAFQRAKPSNPMTACHFISERLVKQLGIPNSARDESGQGRIAKRMAAKSPAPDQSEFDAMKRRQEDMARIGSNATMAVFPVQTVNASAGTSDAAHLATLLLQRDLCSARAVNVAVDFERVASRNEQAVLWGLARAFQAHIQANPPESDYALLADYMVQPDTQRVWAVHFVVCDRQGAWVIVDYQNEHHADFQRIAPKTLADCGVLVTQRLAGYLQ